MSNITSNIFTSSQIFPKYVCDETLRRAAQVDSDGNTAIRVIADDEEPDLTEIKQRIGAKDEAKWDNSVDTNPGSIISILKAIENKITPQIIPRIPPTANSIVDIYSGDLIPKTSFSSATIDNIEVTVSGYTTDLYICFPSDASSTAFVLFLAANLQSSSRYISIPDSDMICFGFPVVYKTSLPSSGKRGISIQWSDSSEMFFGNTGSTSSCQTMIPNGVFNLRTFFS